MKYLELLEAVDQLQQAQGQQPQQSGQLASQVAQALQKAGWQEGMGETPQGSTYYMHQDPANEQTEFRVPVVNSKDPQNAQQGQVTSQAFNAAIDQLYRQARSSGATFTQPVGMPGTAWERDDLSGTVMQFFVK